MTAVLEITGEHPLAAEWPILDDTLAEITESIRENGLRQPVVVTPDGLILDGRTRYRACQALDVIPDLVVYEGEDHLEYIVDANAGRRHLSTGSRAMVVARMLVSAGRRENGKWAYGTNRQISDGSDAMRVALINAGAILDHAPDLAPRVVSGELALDAAHLQAEQIRKAETDRLDREDRYLQEEADAKTFIEEQDPDLAKRVDGNDLETYAEARDVWNRRNREEAARLRQEKEAHEKEQRDFDTAMTSQYSTIARALQITGSYGSHQNIEDVMTNFSKNYLHPPEYEREFTIENLRDAHRFTGELIKWKANQDD